MKKHRPRPKKQHPKSQRQRAGERSERQEAVDRLIIEADDNFAPAEYELKLDVIDRALKLAPFDSRAIHRRAMPLFGLGRFMEALAAVDRSIAAYRLDRMPAVAMDFSRELRAETLYALGRFDDAFVEANRVKDKGRVGAALTRARALAALRRDDEAISAFNLAMENYEKADDRGDNNPHKVTIEFANALLRLGDFERGLQLYDKYLSPDNFRHVDPFTPLAQRSVAGRKILIRTENGLGTVFLFLRYIVALVEAGAKVVLETPAKLVRLLRENNLNGVEVIREGDALPYCDTEWMIEALPIIFATRMDNILPIISHVTAPADRLEYWKQRLALQPGRKMAVICWTGGDQKGTLGRHRTIPLSEVEAILNVEGITFVSIERFLPAAEFERLKGRFDILHVGDEAEKDMADLAAVIALADFVIAPDNTSAQLAGAMGKPTWVMLPFVADWRWHVDRDDCLWFPSMHLFRQHQFGDWASVISRVVAHLAPSINSQRRADEALVA